MIILENETLRVEISSFGAEVKSVYNKKSEKEYMWQGDPKWWKRTSPVLFPVVGNLKDNSYWYEDIMFTLESHGFLRDNECNVVEEANNKVTFEFTYNEDTLKKYPFKFRVEVEYVLVDNGLEHIWRIFNIGDKPMYYSIGAHPAFNLTPDHDYSFEIVGDEMESLGLKGSFISGSLGAPITKFPLNKELFDLNTAIYTNVDTLFLKDDTQNTNIEVRCKDFKFCAIWSPIVDGEMAPFVCIEPWMGINDTVDTTQNLKEKYAINKLLVNKEDVYSYWVIFNEE